VTTWAAVLAVALGSFALRYVPLVLGGRLASSPAARRVVDLAGASALAALVAAAVRAQAAGARPGSPVAVLAAVAVGAVLCHRGRSMPVVLVAGLVTSWAVIALAGP
jgi:branched-subunit amino acid transport protein